MCSAGSGYLIPGLIRECQQLVELTGDQGDVVLMHPFVMHRVSGNPSGRARFSELRNAAWTGLLPLILAKCCCRLLLAVSNPAVRLREPMNFNRPSADDFSPVERAVLRGLGVERLDFRPTRPRLLIPFGGLGVRTAEQRVHELEQLDAEKEAMAAGGLTWDPAYDERQYGVSREEVLGRGRLAVTSPHFRPRMTSPRAMM